MQIINYIFMFALIISGIISMIPKYHKLGIKLLRFIVPTFALLKFAEIIYPYINGIVK